MLGDDFFLWFLETEGADVGMSGSGRPRIYVIAANKLTGRVLTDPKETFEIIRARIREEVQTTPSAYLFAAPNEILIEAMKLAATRHIEFKSEPGRIQNLLFMI